MNQIDHIISELNTLKDVINELMEKKNDGVPEVFDRSPEQGDEPNGEQGDHVVPGSSADDEHTVEQTVRPIRRRLNRSYPLNRSKFLNEEQRDQVLQFASNHKTEILNQLGGNRIQFFQNLVRDRLNINLSLYMSGKLIQIMMQDN